MKVYKTSSSSSSSDLDPFFVSGMANLFREDTNLPMNVWTSPKGNAKHVPRVKASESVGELADMAASFSMSIEDEPRLLVGNPSKSDMSTELAKWIVLNKELLLDYWYGRIGSTKKVLLELKPLP